MIEGTESIICPTCGCIGKIVNKEGNFLICACGEDIEEND